MGTEALVDRDIKDGESLVRQLDQDNFPVTAAFWYYDSESDKWKMMIASNLVDKRGPLEAYRRLLESIKRIISTPEENGFSLDSARIELIKEGAQIPSLLRKAIRTMSGEIVGIRFKGNTVNGFLIEDAYIYRVV